MADDSEEAGGAEQGGAEQGQLRGVRGEEHGDGEAENFG